MPADVDQRAQVLPHLSLYKPFVFVASAVGFELGAQSVGIGIKFGDDAPHLVFGLHHVQLAPPSAHGAYATAPFVCISL